MRFPVAMIATTKCLLCEKPIGFGAEYMVNDMLSGLNHPVIAHADCLRRTLLNECPHDSWSGDEGPVEKLGRMPVRWKCDGCGLIKVDAIVEPIRAALTASEEGK